MVEEISLFRNNQAVQFTSLFSSDISSRDFEALKNGSRVAILIVLVARKPSVLCDGLDDRWKKPKWRVILQSSWVPGDTASNILTSSYASLTVSSWGLGRVNVK